MGTVYEFPAEPPVGVTVATPEGDLYTREREAQGWTPHSEMEQFYNGRSGWTGLLARYKRLQEVDGKAEAEGLRMTDIAEFLTARWDEIEEWVKNPPGAVSAYVRADIAAKRQILALHGTHSECEVCFRLDDESSSTATSQTWENEEAPCETVRLLAAPFADHPDFDPAWRVG